MLLAGILAMSLVSFSQIQRLAVLPAAMRLTADGEKLSSLCIDLFADDPAGEAFGEIGSNFEPKYQAEGHEGIFGTNGNLPAKMFFAGTENVEIPQYYRNFLTSTINRYKAAEFNSAKFDQLQDEIWAYNGMDEFGEIDRDAADQVAEFRAKSKDFAFKYDIVRETRAKTYSAIVSKAEHLHIIGAPFPLTELTGKEFTEAGISLIEAGNVRTIEVQYGQGTSFATLKEPSEVFGDVDQFRASYGSLPEKANVAKYTKDQKFYVLSLVAEGDGYAPIKMNFLVANIKGFGLENKLPGTTTTSEVCILTK